MKSDTFTVLPVTPASVITLPSMVTSASPALAEMATRDAKLAVVMPSRLISIRPCPPRESLSKPVIRSRPKLVPNAKKSSPVPPSRLSFPVPPLSTSTPMPPLRTSIPAPPDRLSLPFAPYRLSSPSPPSSTSLPMPSDSWSFPPIPKRRSFPEPPVMVLASAFPVAVKLP